MDMATPMLSTGPINAGEKPCAYVLGQLARGVLGVGHEVPGTPAICMPGVTWTGVLNWLAIGQSQAHSNVNVLCAVLNSCVTLDVDGSLSSTQMGSYTSSWFLCLVAADFLTSDDLVPCSSALLSLCRETSAT